MTWSASSADTHRPLGVCTLPGHIGRWQKGQGSPCAGASALTRLVCWYPSPRAVVLGRGPVKAMTSSPIRLRVVAPQVYVHHMGLLRSKEDKLVGPAQDAWAQGRPVWVAKLTVAADPTSAPLDAWTDAVTGVESVGWRLSDISMSEAKGWLTAVLIFRR